MIYNLKLITYLAEWQRKKANRLKRRRQKGTTT
jgi:hypothetical protein